jgi:hypothetical protein
VVVFFYLCDYEVLMGTLGVGRYTKAALLAQFNWLFDNSVDSLTIAPGYKITLFDFGDFTGRSITLTQDVPCLTAYEFIDVTSSLIIELGRTLTPHGTIRLST